MLKLALLSALLLPATVLATPGGRCSGSNSNGLCICLDRKACESYAEHGVQVGKKGDYPCPFDSSNIIGCYVGDCAGGGTICAFSEGCKSVKGRPLSNPTCPGGNNYFCCKAG